MKQIALSFATLFLVSSVNAASPTRFIRGSADPRAQIVVTNEVTGSVMGYVADKDGQYKAGPLVPGRYSIVENAPHHATRHLELVKDRDGQVDL